MSFKENLSKYGGVKIENIPRFITFLAVAVLVVIVIVSLNVYITWIGPVVLFVALAFIVLLSWGFAGHTVMKSLFWIGADLTLIIYLAKSYCEAPSILHKADDSLKILLAFGLLFVGIKFILNLYAEMVNRIKHLKEINDNRNPWIITIPFAIFTGVFVWQAYQVISPIVLGLCIYQ